MTPKDKAEEIILNYESIIVLNSWCDENTTEKEINRLIKLCALIAVDEILEATIKYVAIREKVEYSKTGFDNVVHSQYDKFWQEVKQEIEKL
jgi:hypothetical protein